MMEVLVGNRAGSSAYLYNDFIYHKHRANSNGSVTYICWRRNCRGRVREVGGNIIVCKEHNHGEDREEVEKLRLKMSLRGEARLATNQKMRKLFDDVCER